MDQVNQKLESISKHFEHMPGLKIVSEKTGLEPAKIVIGALLASVLLLVLGLGASLIISAVGILYPAYMSFKAIESPEEDDDKMWLTYWTIFALYNFADKFVDYLFFWVPFYSVIKLLVLVYMFFPSTRGAMTFYNRIAQPIFKAYESKIDEFISSVSQEIDSSTGKKNS